MGQATSRRKAPGRARGERLEARITGEQKALFRRAADLQGRTLTDFVVSSAHEAAVRAVRDDEIIRLGEADSRAFADALLRPRKPNPALRAAARRYRHLFGA